MISVLSGVVFGLQAFLIDVEVDVRPGLPGFEIVGLPSATVKESRERVRSALRNSGYKFPSQRVIVNLAPAYYRKDGALFDVPIALGILAHQGVISPAALNNTIFVGELSLSGRIKRINGVLSLGELATEKQYKLVLPWENQNKLSLLPRDSCLLTGSLTELVKHLNGNGRLKKPNPSPPRAQTTHREAVPILGQKQAKRALEIAAAGSFPIMLIGPPGVGKTLLAKQAINLLPPPTQAEIITLNKIQQVTELLADQHELITRRPLRAPHHSVSAAGLIGGKNGKPGEITLAHLGILLLDEFPEFNQAALQSLREPLDQKAVRISRAEHVLHYPADFWLVATANPCPCGYYGSNIRLCSCSRADLNRYRRKLRGPLIDRLAMVCYLHPLSDAELLEPASPWPSFNLERFTKEARDIKISPSATGFLLQAQKILTLSVRAYQNTLAVAKTIALLDGLTVVKEEQIAEALQYRFENQPELFA